MLKVGLTGGIASGKSTVSEIFELLGAKLIDADVISRQIMKKGSNAYNRIVSYFGNDILSDEMEIDRRKLGSIVFSNPMELEVLNAITHPEIIKKENIITSKISIDNPTAIIIVNAALIIESGSYVRFDKLILIYASLETQVKRLVKRDGMKESQAQSRIKSQMPFEEKRRFADYIIDNDGSMKVTKIQCNKIYRELLKINP
jgi:dephospho-CoA kinase